MLSIEFKRVNLAVEVDPLQSTWFATRYLVLKFSLHPYRIEVQQ
jgi:hypothetical protein